MDSIEFLATVNWETTIYDVVLISEETEENPAVWECRIKPVDYNNVGSDIPVELDFQLVDNAGHCFRITNKDKYAAEKRVQVTDIFRVWPECPHPDLTGFVCKTVGDGEAPHVTPAMLDRLDDKAKDYLQSIEKDILWRYPKDINEKWHPEGLVFSIDTTNNKLIKWTAGKFVITKWPEGLESEYRIENVISKSAYHPERKYTIASGSFTCADDELVYIYAVLPVAKNETNGIIVIEKTYRFERYYTDMLTVLIGVYNVPNEEGFRPLIMQWSGNEKQYPPDTIYPESENETLNGNHTHKFNPGKFVTQTAHGFTFGTCIKRDGAGAWIKSKANTRENAGTVGIVSEVIDADHFRYITGGLLPGTFVDGADYWLSTTTAGDIFIQSDPEVWEIGNVREFIGTGTANGLEIEIDLGDEITEFDLGGGGGGENSHPPVTIAADSTDLASIGTDQILHINPLQIVKSGSSGSHEVYLIENTENTNEVITSSWTIIPYAERVGEFKATVLIRDKVENNILTLQSLLSFDYTDSESAADAQNDFLTDPENNVYLSLDINSEQKLFVNISGMNSNAKRIHICLERCVLSERHNPADDPGLLLTFDSLTNIPVADNSLATWNTFFDLPNRGGAFTYLVTYPAENKIKLVGGVDISLKESLFENNLHLIGIEDQTGAITYIENNAFSGAAYLNIIILQAVVEILDSSFSYVGSANEIAISEISMPELISVGEYAFSNARVKIFNFPKLVSTDTESFGVTNATESFNLPLLEVIGAGCFRESSALEFDFPNATSLLAYPTSEGMNFILCSSATLFNLPLITNITKQCFQGCSAVNTVFNLDNAISAGEAAFQECSGCVGFSFPNLETIGEECFALCTDALEFVIPKLSSCGRSAFDSCSSCTEFSFPLLTALVDSTFYGCSVATTFDLPEVITTLSGEFYNCISATNIYLPKCTNLGSTQNNENVFGGIYGNTITLTITTTAMTSNYFGTPDNDILMLQENNTVTIIQT